jgi:outer membrane protein assembly factor BamB
MDMRLTAKIIIVASLFSIGACSSLNPFASKPDPKTLPAPLQDFKVGMAVKSAWSVTLGSSGVYVFSPAQTGDFVYAAAADGAIVKLKADSGQQVWRINAGQHLTAGVGADGDTIVVAGEKGSLLAFDQDGQLRWKAQASSEVLSAPAVGQGLVVVRSVDNKVVAFDALTGVKKWTVDRPLPALILRSTPGLAITDQSVVVALPGGRLAALSLLNGGPRWEVSAGDPKGATELERIADVTGAPAVFGRDICATSYQGRVGCYDAATGAARWTKNLSSEVGPGIDERFVFAVDDKGNVSAFARNTGSSVWRNDKLINRKLSAPTSFAQAVVVGDFEGQVHFLSREDGAEIARVPTDGSRIITAPIVAGSNLIVQTKSGTVVAIAAQ